MTMELTQGTLVPFLAREAITREQLRAYADASGDFNPIHLDDEVARRAGLPGIIAHGMLTAGFLAERALQFAGKEAGRSELKLRDLQTRFKAMTVLGDVITVGGAVKDANGDGLTLDLEARNQRGEVTTTAVARFVRG
jgi:acyl dehydratase